MGTGSDKDSIIFFSQSSYGDILANSRIQLYFHPQLFDGLNLSIKDFFGKTVFGNTHSKHSTGNRQGFKNRNLITLNRQIISRCKTGWTSTNHCYFFIFSLFYLRQIFGLVIEIKIRHKPLEIHDGNRLIHLPPSAGRLAGMVANPSTHGRKWILLFNKFQRFFIFTFGNKRHITLDTDMGWTRRLARGGSQLVNGKGTWYSLGKFPINCLPLPKILLKFRGK